LFIVDGKIINCFRSIQGCLKKSVDNHISVSRNWARKLRIV
jgi:hypothetical protein